LIPAGYKEDDYDWPSDGEDGIEKWVDSNTLIKYRISDSPVQMMGAQLYYTECTIEYYGEEEADLGETSARDGTTLRNFPEVDPETGLAMIYSYPKEVSSLYGENTLPLGASRMAQNLFGNATKFVDQFEFKGEAPPVV
jgi:hypothetical protein